MQNKGEHWIRSGGANVLKFHINANLIIYQHGSKYNLESKYREFRQLSLETWGNKAFLGYFFCSQLCSHQVPKVFPSSSQSVPIKFPRCSHQVLK
ncbi:unnamed protein product, partial [Sphagnum jensenii]